MQDLIKALWKKKKKDQDFWNKFHKGSENRMNAVKVWINNLEINRRNDHYNPEQKKKE